MAPIAQKAMADAGVTADDIQVFIPHQANMRIIDQMKSSSACPTRGGRRATSPRPATRPRRRSRSPTERLLAEGQAKSGDLALQIGFGAGLVYAAQVVVLPSRCPTQTARVHSVAMRQADQQTLHAPQPLRETEPMAYTEQEILAGLAEIVAEETGLPTDRSRSRSPSRTTSTSTRCR